MFIFLPLLINSVTIGLSFLLVIISAIISSKTINILRFLFRFYFLCFVSCGFLAYKKILSIFGFWIIRLNSESVFPDPEPPTINILLIWFDLLFLMNSSWFVLRLSMLILFFSTYFFHYQIELLLRTILLRNFQIYVFSLWPTFFVSLFPFQNSYLIILLSSSIESPK